MERNIPKQTSEESDIDCETVSPRDPKASDVAWREYLFFREELRHEDGLINQRVSWLISSQAFLLGGFATLISTSNGQALSALDKLRHLMLHGLPLAGILGVVASYVTILAAVLHVRGIRRIATDLHLARMPSLRNWHTLQLRMGLFGPLVTPLIFLAFWIAILVKMQ